ncbi:MAG: hypothetical protein QOD99_1233 [Chthoniobacter sp.]|jgi:uncharacterized protein YecT (DUF1311 family)|nr:hypothetical protein [Chthoniobacter sp.]
MKKFLQFAIVAISVFITAHPHSLAQSQHEMNRQAEADFQKADAELNKVYHKIMAELDSEAQTKMKAAQRAWIVFRDAQAEYEADADARGGSMYPQLYYGECADLTRRRIKQLRGPTKCLA